MDPTALIPPHGAFQVPWGWFQAFLLVSFVIHLLLVNTLLGSAMMSLAEGVVKTSSGPVSRHSSKKIPTVMALTINFGVPPLLFLQVLYGQFYNVADILAGVYRLAVVLVLICAYYAAYAWDFRFQRLGRLRLVLLSLVVAALLYVAFVFTNSTSMMLRPEAWKGYFANSGGTLLNSSDPSLWPRYLHFVVASLAVGGLVQGLYWSRKSRRMLPGSRENVRRGMQVFAYATAFQVAIGSWWLVSLPADVLELFLGGKAFPSLLLAVGMAGVAACLISGLRQQPVPALFSVLATIGVMTGLREMVRYASLEPFYAVSQVPAQGEWSPLLLFLGAFLVSACILALVLRYAYQSRKWGA